MRFCAPGKHSALSVIFPLDYIFLKYPLLRRSISLPLFFLDFPLLGIIEQLTFAEISSDENTTMATFASRFALSVSYLCCGSIAGTSCQNAFGHSPSEYIFQNKFGTPSPFLFFFSYFSFSIRRSKSSLSLSKTTTKNCERAAGRKRERQRRRRRKREYVGVKIEATEAVRRCDERRERERKMRQRTSVYPVACPRPIELRFKNEKKKQANERTKRTLSACLHRENRASPRSRT